MKYLKTFEQKSITELDYSKQNLTSLPELPESLEILYCHNNELTYLPALPESLEILYCNNNNLSELPALPDSLKVLYCFNNNLPYKDLDGYKEWLVQYIIDNPNSDEAIRHNSKKYNL